VHNTLQVLSQFCSTEGEEKISYADGLTIINTKAIDSSNIEIDSSMGITCINVSGSLDNNPIEGWHIVSNGDEEQIITTFGTIDKDGNFNVKVTIQQLNAQIIDNIIKSLRQNLIMLKNGYDKKPKLQQKIQRELKQLEILHTHYS
jgi:hypothetical protein